jgi:motility quorum-sensing regulator/GCU-specific mRNA interferase toxin
MEKFNPSYSLTEFKNSNYGITVTAKMTAKELGFDIEGIDKVISTMELKHFYKSMTSYANHRIWQDVYHVPYGNLVLYIKFTQNVISEFTLLSFKEK